MQLNDEGLKNRKFWEDRGYLLPEYDREAMKKETKEHPRWIHFGAGNIFRAFHAAAAGKLLSCGEMRSGITVVEGFDYEIIEKMYRPHDDLSILVTLKSDGAAEKTVVGSIGESCILDSENEEEYARLKEIFSSATLQLATFTITEKGYSLVDGKGELLPAVKEDFEKGPGKPKSYIGKVASLLYERYKNGARPIAMVSTDNCSHNGDKLKEAIRAFAKKWREKGFADPGFEIYLFKEGKVSFPWSMIDKITPRPDPAVEELLKKDEIEGLENVVTSKKTWVAPFVNAEECEYLVIEDDFPAGRPDLGKAGFLFTDRETVDKVERMKVCTCLNPLHTALAVFGCLLGYERISEEMKDPQLKRMVERIGYDEGLPVVTDPKVIDPKEFIDTVLNVRIPNPFMPDTPQRIATDTSQKIPIRYGETIKNYMASGRSLEELKLIPLVFAGWIRYLTGINDEGEPFEPSPDPLLDTVKEYVKGVTLDLSAEEKEKAAEAIGPLLSDPAIFGVDLGKTGLSEKVKGYYKELLDGKGAVRRTLEKYV